MTARMDATQEVRSALEHARDYLDASDDPSETDIIMAIAWLQVELGDLDRSELEQPDPECICPPELLARGGFKGGCLVHG